MTPKERMLMAYRGRPCDRPPVAPEFWYYYPARLLGVDMAEFRTIPFHRALKVAFEHFGCEGWGIVTPHLPPPADVTIEHETRPLDEHRLETLTRYRMPDGCCQERILFERQDAAVWAAEHPIKDWERDLPLYLHFHLDRDPEEADVKEAVAAWEEVGESYLLEANLGSTFFDFIAPARAGGIEQAIADFMERERELEAVRERYGDFMVRKARAFCRQTPFESFFIGCTWSCLSLLSPDFWRRWDRPILAAVADELHRHGRLLHHHFHGRCREVVADFAEIGLDCVCPFERPPGGDIAGLPGLREVADRLAGRTTFNGNVHTVETLIRGTPDDVRREVREIRAAFEGNPRLIIGTGDQVGAETPEENLWAMIEAATQ